MNKSWGLPLQSSGIQRAQMIELRKVFGPPKAIITVTVVMKHNEIKFTSCKRHETRAVRFLDLVACGGGTILKKWHITDAVLPIPVSIFTKDMRISNNNQQGLCSSDRYIKPLIQQK